MAPCARPLIVDLEQSPYLNVMPDQKLREALQLMGRTPEERINTTVGREICLSDGIKAMLTASISNLGGEYVVSLEAINSATGDSLGQEQEQASRKEDVLNALGKAASVMRQKLGESLASVQQFDKPLEEATTSSLEALKAFSLGEKLHNASEDLASVPFFQHAIELDPNFALAYARLGTAYNNLNQNELGGKFQKDAFDRRTRASASACTLRAITTVTAVNSKSASRHGNSIARPIRAIRRHGITSATYTLTHSGSTRRHSPIASRRRGSIQPAPRPGVIWQKNIAP
jgi:tetratricopeptide (TPR) repeat protein